MKANQKNERIQTLPFHYYHISKMVVMKRFEYYEKLSMS
jgi:hypothetical protein